MTRSPLQQKIELVLLLLACESGLLPTRPLGFSCVCFSQCLPHLDSALTLSLSTWVVAVFFVFFSVSQQPQRFCLLVDSQVWEVDRLVYLNVLAGHVLPFGSLDASVHSLTDGIPVLIGERWPPSVVSHIRCVDEGAQHTFFFSSQRQPIRSFTHNGFRDSAVTLGFTTGSDSCAFTKSPILTAS